MKKVFLIFAMSLMMASSLSAQRVTVDNFDRLCVHFRTPDINVKADDYLRLSADGYIAGGELGAPALPMLSHMLTVPFCDSMVVEVENAVYDTLLLPNGQLYPLQPSAFKNGTSMPFCFNDTVYGTDAFFARPLASVSPLGIGRDRCYATLVWSPVSVNPVSRQMVVCRSADVTVRYIGSDPEATLRLYTTHRSPAFSLGPTLNTLVAAKEGPSTSPLRMVVVVPSALQCAAIHDFVAWKQKQGIVTELLEVDNSWSAGSIAATLQSFYDEATAENPAPTFVLLVGDNNVMPVFNTRMSSSLRSYVGTHVTDLYYTTWTGDKLPDAYWGRFSARDTSTLRAIIDKTLYYERYQFADDRYLGRAALIAGVDNVSQNDPSDNGYRCADPSMDYIASNYIVGSTRFDSLVYYKNNTNRVPAGVVVNGCSQNTPVAQDLRTLYNQGVGWVNYSAHGDWDCWYRPSFTITHVKGTLSNYGKPTFMIGNCCLTNKFNMSECFGEALLRKGNRAGAVCYIGATNSTMWDEDFYWSVGVRGSVSNGMSIAYDANNRGMYDNLFHTHGEALSDCIATAGQMVMAGNMSVNRTYGTSSWANAITGYYWEIYELMGDPSLLPWLGRADDLEIASLGKSNGMLVVPAVPGAYVAVVDTVTGTPLQAAVAADDGEVRLSWPDGDLAPLVVSITAQGYKPLVCPLATSPVGLAQVDAGIQPSITPNPATDRCTVAAAGLQRVAVMNVMGQTLRVVDAEGDRCDISLDGLVAGLYLLRVETASGVSTSRLIRQ